MKHFFSQHKKHFLLIPLLIFTSMLFSSQPAEHFANFPVSPEDQATQFPRGDISYGTKTPITLNRSGTYQLTGPLTASAAVAALTLSANNITLDLAGNVISGGTTGIAVTGNEAVVRNGTIRNTGASGTVGIKITGSRGQFENLDVISTNTGFLLQNTSANQITNCRAIASTNSGFSLVSSSTNNFTNCQALSTNGGTRSAYGFISQSGYGNNFQECVAQDTKTQSVLGNIAAGYVLSGETASIINDSQAFNSFSLSTTAKTYGIFLKGQLNSLNFLQSQTPFSGVASLAWAPDGTALAVGNQLGASIQIYFWNGTTLTPGPTYTPGGVNGTYALAWSPNGNYLAVGTFGDASNGAKLTLYSWNGSTLTVLSGFPLTPAGWAVLSQIYALAWSPDSSYLALGGSNSSGNQLKVYSWNGSTLTQQSSITPNTASYIVQSLDWSSDGKYLALGCGASAPSNNQLKIYSWSLPTLTPLVSITPANWSTVANSFVRTLKWSPDGQFLAMGGYNYGATPALQGNQLKVYSWNGTTVTQLQSLTPWTPIAFISNFPYTLAWSPDGQYIGVGGLVDAAVGNQLQIYSWNRVILTLQQSITPRFWSTSDDILALSWSPNGKYIGLVGNTATNNLEIYTGLTLCSSCIVKHNTVTNNTNAAGNGIGISADSSVNYVAENTGYNNNTNFQNVSSTYLASQANARGVYNVDTSLNTPDMLQTINTNVAGDLPEGFSIQSKMDVISSKIDRFASTTLSCACTPIQNGGTTNTNKNFITGPITLTQSGNYCLSGNCGGGITVSGSNITLDLNNYTLNGGTNGLTVSGSTNIIRNGTIKNATTNGVNISGSRCMLENLDVVGSPTGFYISNAGYNLLNNCQALNCTQNGFYLNGGTCNSLTNCRVSNLGGSTASSTVVSGFLARGGQANVFDSCTVENAFTNVNSASARAQGFAIAAEDYSTISNCTVNGVSTSAALPNLYGIRCPMLLDQVATNTSRWGKNGIDASWLEYQGRRYLAAAFNTGAGPEVAIFEYIGTTSLQQKTGIELTAQARAVSFVNVGNNNYLAVGTADSATANEVLVYRFTPPATLALLSSFEHNNYVNSVDWLESCTSGSTQLYLASGCFPTSGINLRILPFSGTTLGAPLSQQIGIATDVVQGATWMVSDNGRFYLAVTPGSVTTGQLQVYEFVAMNQPLNLVASFNTGPAIRPVACLKTNTGKFYIATGLAFLNTNQIQVFEFDPNATTKLVQKATYQHATVTPGATGTYIYSVAWLPGIDDLSYLAICGAPGFGGYTTRVLRFDGSCLTPIFNYNAGGKGQLDWLSTGSTMIGLACENTNLPVQALGFSPTRNQIYNNNVTNVNGGSSATAYAVEANNLLIGNLASNNSTDYYYTPEAGDSNRGF